MQKWDTVAIVGVGLIGGSIGLAIRKQGIAHRVVGIGRNQHSLRKATRAGAISSATTDLARGVADADLVVVCTPVRAIAQHVEQTAAACPRGALITDAGSTKAAIVARLDGQMNRGVRFVGSHPMAGSEKRGPENASAELFEGCVAVVTPSRHTSRRDRRAVADFWTALGARVVEMTPQAHDRVVALISHLPHLAASALAAAVGRKYFPLAGGGLRDTTRVADGDPELWTQILLENRQNVLTALRSFDSAVDSLRDALERQDATQLRRALSKAKRNRDALGS